MAVIGVALIVILWLCASQASSRTITLNERPIIGVLAQETSTYGFQSKEHKNKYGDSYIRSDYFKFAQQSGALAVPIKIKQPKEYYIDMFNNINGVIFPGGDVNITDSGYATAGKILYDLAVDANKKGDYFPLVGICLGFELLTALTSGRDLLSYCDAENLPLPLDFTKDSKKSRLFKLLPENLETGMREKPVTMNFHHFCLTVKEFHNNDSHLSDFYHVLSTNVDRKNLEFVSTFEAKEYPFYGFQWHPEKNIYSWDTTLDIRHSEFGVQVSQYLSNFIVNDSRKSSHKFPDLVSQASALIDNFNSVFLGAPTFKDNYYFNSSSTA